MASTSEDGYSCAGDDGDPDYHPPEHAKELWKNFGCDTEAGRLLRNLYGNKPQKDGASKISYPKVGMASKWEPKPKAKGPCPQKAQVRVPKPGHRQRPDPDNPDHWYFPAGGKKQLDQIIADTDDYLDVPEKPAPGRNQDKEKDDLQQKFQFGGGNAMPKGAMGSVPKGDVPRAQPRPDKGPDIDETGMTREQREIFEELIMAVQRKQARLKEIDAEEAEEKAANKKAGKDQTERNKEALQLQNDIDRLLKDIDKLMELSE